jgi:hypothetical protein
MEINYCNHTGLLYVNGVAFTRERIALVKSVLENNKKLGEQFEYSVNIKDTANKAEVTVTPVILEGIEFIAAAHPDGIASDEDFQ